MLSYPQCGVSGRRRRRRAQTRKAGMPGCSARRENRPLHTEPGAHRQREATAPPPIPSQPRVLKLLQQSPVFLLAEE